MDTHDTINTKMATELVDYARELIASSPFFSGLERGLFGPRHVQYVFEQYGLWRDGFHTWFGLAIMKSGSCTPETRNATISSLAQHVLAEMQEDHAAMYQELLKGLGISKKNPAQESLSTRKYRCSFVQRFGIGEYNFIESVVALSGRELLASTRNQSLQRSLASWYQISKSHWVDLHESLEIEHFAQTIAPLMYEADKKDITRFVSLIQQEMALHVSYWDDLLRESSHTSDEI